MVPGLRQPFARSALAVRRLLPAQHGRRVRHPGVVHRPGRDSRVTLGEGVVVVTGRFSPSGGSSKYPEIGGTNIVIEIRDIPLNLARHEVKKWGDSASIVQDIQYVTKADEREQLMNSLREKLNVSDEEIVLLALNMLNDSDQD